MAENSKIEWTDHTFNPWLGCMKVSPGCDHCYAEGWAKRSGLVKWGPGTTRRRTSIANWGKPIRWDKEAAAAGVRRRVFCASLADVFDNEVPAAWREDLWELIEDTPNLDWLLLTKRIGNAKGMLPANWDGGYPNVWLGASIVNQAEADRDIPKLLAVRALIHFLSCEPLLGPINLRRIVLAKELELSNTEFEVRKINLTIDATKGCNSFKWAPLDWVIVGGESGHHARPMELEWVDSLRSQVAGTDTSFFFKQGSQANWPDFKNFESFPKSMRVREWPCLT